MAQDVHPLAVRVFLLAEAPLLPEPLLLEDAGRRRVAGDDLGRERREVEVVERVANPEGRPGRRVSLPLLGRADQVAQFGGPRLVVDRQEDHNPPPRLTLVADQEDRAVVPLLDDGRDPGLVPGQGDAGHGAVRRVVVDRLEEVVVLGADRVACRAVTAGEHCAGHADTGRADRRSSTSAAVLATGGPASRSVERRRRPHWRRISLLDVHRAHYRPYRPSPLARSPPAQQHG